MGPVYFNLPPATAAPTYRDALVSPSDFRVHDPPQVRT